jgi:hypothetical protein
MKNAAITPATLRRSGVGSRTAPGSGVTALAYYLGNFVRTLAMSQAEPWSLTTLREKLIKIDARVVSHGRYVTFRMAEVAVRQQTFQEILSLIARLGAPPAPAWGVLRSTAIDNDGRVHLERGKATSSSAAGRVHRRFGCQRGRLPSNFLAMAPRRDGKSRPPDRESGGCRLMHHEAPLHIDADQCRRPNGEAEISALLTDFRPN